ncbi:MAG: hypothetical protein ABI868_03415 [Acidobacteriota bacterium]
MRSLLPVLLVVALHADDALCQNPPSPLARVDITATVGSFSARRTEAPEYDEWTHSLFTSAGGGYYWTDHLKTEIDVASIGRSKAYGNEPADVPDAPGSTIFLIHGYQGFAISAGQSYQFGRNALFHPFVTGGVDVERRRHEIDRPAQSVAVYTRSPLNPQSVQVSRQIPIPALQRTVSTVTVAPYAAAGFKAYFTERGFFRTDLKVTGRGGIDRVVWRAGFGVDF